MVFHRTGYDPFVFVAAFLLAGCVDSLPDQDRRIRAAVPIAKLSASDLWQDYQKDRAEADRKYWGKAIEVSGKVTIADAQDSPAPYVLFGQTERFGVRANLLDDTAAAVLKLAVVGQRIRLRCFCEGLDGHVILKSCIAAE